VSPSTDVLLLSLGTTLGWRVADTLFLEQLERAGVSTAAVSVGFGAAGRLRRGYPANDLVEALAVRRALRAAIARHHPRAVVISSTTAAMLADPGALPFAVRLDAPARLNRPGARNAPLHALERRALGAARLVLPWSDTARAALPPASAPAVVVPPPVVASGVPGRRERLAVAYAPDVKGKGLDIVCGAWEAAGLERARLVVFGVDTEVALAHLRRSEEPAGVSFAGRRAPHEFRAALRRAHVYLGGARWEDFGQAPLEALADGALLATVPSGGPFAALDLARRLAPELVAGSLDPRDLARALRAAFDLPDDAQCAYRERAARLLEPYRPEAIERVVARAVVPALLTGAAPPR
jgi:glycosyltransferase involved in cell wall biosynthesis